MFVPRNIGKRTVCTSRISAASSRGLLQSRSTFDEIRPNCCGASLMAYLSRLAGPIWLRLHEEMLNVPTESRPMLRGPSIGRHSRPTFIKRAHFRASKERALSGVYAGTVCGVSICPLTCAPPRRTYERRGAAVAAPNECIRKKRDATAVTPSLRATRGASAPGQGRRRVRCCVVLAREPSMTKALRAPRYQ